MNMHTNKIHKSLLLVLTMLVSILLITGCISVDVNSNLKFCRSGDWYADMEVIASSYDINRSGGAYKTDNEIDELVNTFVEKGGTWSWRRTSREGSYIWNISGEGKTVYEMISILGEDAQINYEFQDGERILHIVGTPYTGFQIDHYNFSISSGQIISSNADYIEGNTAHWDLDSYEQIDIKLTEGWCWEPYRYWILGGVITIVLIGVGIGIFLIIRKRGRVQSHESILDGTQPKPPSHIKTLFAKFYTSLHSVKIRNLLNPALIGIFTWSWIAGGAVAIVAIVQSVYTQCTWLISTFGGMQFLGCSSSTDTTIFVFYLGLEFCATGFAGFMGTFAGKSLKSGAKAGALAIFIPSLAEATASLIDMGSSAFPLSCISLPLSLTMSVAFGAFLGTVGGWIGLEISRRKKSNEPPVLEISILSKGRTVFEDDKITRGDKVVVQVKVGDFSKAKGIRLFINNQLLQETQKSNCAFEIDTARLTPGKYAIRVEATGINDIDWLKPTIKEQAFFIPEEE